MAKKEKLVNITVYTDGDFDVSLPDSEKPLEATEDMDKFFEGLSKGAKKGSMTTPLLTYLKTGSGWIIIGGRRYWIP